MVFNVSMHAGKLYIMQTVLHELSILRHFGNLLYICSVAKMTAITGMSNTFASGKLFKMKQIIVYRLPRV